MNRFDNQNNRSGDKSQVAQPPRWAQHLIRWYCRPDLLEDLQGDLNEYFERNLKTKGPGRARWIYCLDALKFFRLYTIRKPDFLNLFIHWIMIGSYLKTSRRSLVRNKLFSFINIFGLAVSMSVGLLVISLISDFLSYDDFQLKKDRTYRVITSYQNLDEPAVELASTSVKVGQEIRKTVAGIDELTILRNGFSGDAHVGETVVPFEAYWADNSFFKVFSFPLLKGDPATALKEPYSLVLTEKTAKKLFGDVDPLGKFVRFDSLNYTVTGIAKDVPKLSHLRFDALVSFATADALLAKKDPNFHGWENVWQNYVYLVLPSTSDPASLQPTLDKLNAKENAALKNRKFTVALQPLNEVVLSKRLDNSIGPTMRPIAIWILGGLAFIIILSACFNYTNLSIARSLRRSREVGIRKIIGAMKSHVLGQFMAESVIIALMALVFSFGLFLFLRTQFLALDPHIGDLVTLDLSPRIILYFLVFAMVVGLAAGFLPALFFSRINALQVIKDASTVKVFQRISMRKALIVIQYTLSLIFIATTLIGYNQYRGLVLFDLGFTTENILNIRLQGNKGDVLAKELSEIPAVREISQSMMITSLGSIHGTNMKYTDPRDSAMVWLNQVDEHYLPVHNHKLVAGKNFTLRPKKGEESEAIVNEQVLKRFNIAKRDPEKALGNVVTVDGKKLTIVGVLKDFHYGTMDKKIEPVMFRYSADEPWGYLNVKIASTDLPATMASIDKAWRKLDKVHPLEAKFYDDQIEEAYSQFSVMVKVIGFIAFLAICIASLGLFGMVVFTTETRLKEISIRKVLGATEGGLVFLLSRGFLGLLLVASLVALPATYFFFDKVVLTNFAYHQPIGLSELVIGIGLVMLLAFLMIGSQTLKAARNNPAKVLKSE
ncbi:FtsX-like permease family protein [Spirosoma sp. KCTC 42546]|uniref:ABC transporter permease n=1 Tax=Spirosoma sp. KCTC 42546 TaxID=2520506 RepID=UPI00115B4120|nr:ABC transporter permease [Spirosoma sp. KCTC 42546]QDK80364.1 FtsX-like permease family protein [Spirosoma sp. KCTC 42546]